MKKYVSLILTILVVLCMGTVVFAAEPEQDLNKIPTTMEAELQILKQQPAVDAYEELLDNLDIVLPTDPCYPNYPNNYGGAYYEDGYLYICVTDDSAAVQSAYLELVSNPDIVKFEKVEKSYNDLYNLSLQIAEKCGASISSVTVNVYENAVEVGIPTGSEARQLVQKNICVNSKEKASASVIFTDEERSSVASAELIGGQKICWGSSSGTMTICGTFQGKNAILTAGHCVTVGTTYNHLTSSGTTLGTGSYRKYNSYQFYDYGVITLDNDFTLTNKVLNNSNYTTITSQMSSTSGLIGTIICKYGAKKGFATAKVTKANAVATYSDGTTLYGMNMADFETGTGYKGDSGGPVYVGHVLYGIYSGDNSNPNNATHFWYSPIYGVTNFTIKTT